MDTSKQYIKMSDCPEIQDGWKPETGDLTTAGIITGIHFKNIGVLIRDKTDWINLYSVKTIKWLPYQHQSQGMLIKKGVWFDLQISGGGHTQLILLFEGGKRKKFTSDTAEQALMQGVMHELHNKKWDGQGWV